MEWCHIVPNAKQTLKREMQEETKLSIAKFHYNDNAYFAPHEVLIHNYAVIAADDALKPNNEIDQYSWVPVKDMFPVKYRRTCLFAIRQFVLIQSDNSNN